MRGASPCRVAAAAGIAAARKILLPICANNSIIGVMKSFLALGLLVGCAAMAEPVQRTVGGRMRYVSCLRFAPRESDGSYREPRERAILYVNGRLDRVA